MSSSAETGAARAQHAARSLEHRVFDEWSPALRALFDGTALASKVGFTASLVTCDAGGQLRTSLLGIGELYAPDARSLAFALWPTSRAARALGAFAENASRTGSSEVAHGGYPPRNGTARQSAPAALTFVHEGGFHQVQLAVTPMGAISGEGGADGPASRGLAQFIASIDTGEMQHVGYARLTTGITFELSGSATDREAVLSRWQHQIERLKRAAHAALGTAGNDAGDAPRSR